MINKLNNKAQEETPELNTLKVLLQSLKYQLKELDLTNKNIDNLKAKIKRGSYQKGKKEKEIYSEEG